MPFDIGGLELMVLAVVLIVVVGPKDLPGMLRNFGKYVAKARSMAGDFRSQFDEALREAELDDVKTTLDKARALDPTKDIKKAFDPMTKIGQEITRDLNKAAKAPEASDREAKTEVPPASGNADKSSDKAEKASSASTAGKKKPVAKSSAKPSPAGTANGVAQKSAGKSSRRGAGTIKSSSAAKPSGRPKAKAAGAKPASGRKSVQKSAGVEKKS